MKQMAARPVLQLNVKKVYGSDKCGLEIEAVIIKAEIDFYR